MDKLAELRAFVNKANLLVPFDKHSIALDMLQAALDQCESAMGEDETYNFVATYVLIDAMHGAMEADDA